MVWYVSICDFMHFDWVMNNNNDFDWNSLAQQAETAAGNRTMDGRTEEAVAMDGGKSRNIKSKCDRNSAVYIISKQSKSPNAIWPLYVFLRQQIGRRKCNFNK